MKRTISSIPKEFTLSFAMHFVVLGAAIVLSGQFEQKLAEPITVFLSNEMPGGNSGSGLKDIGFQVKKGDSGHFIKTKNITSATVTEKLISFDRIKTDAAEQPVVPANTMISDNGPIRSPLSEGSPEGTSSVGEGSGGPGGGFGSTGTGGQGGSGGGSGTGHGTGSGNSNALSEQYLAEHYGYIRDLIMKHLKYPQIAKKMGWKGKVVVSFLIKENGSVENLKIITGSGHEVLDKNVLTVIKDVQPFPRPPVKAELMIPITYRLE